MAFCMGFPQCPAKGYVEYYRTTVVHSSTVLYSNQYSTAVQYSSVVYIVLAHASTTRTVRYATVRVPVKKSKSRIENSLLSNF